MYGFPRSGRIIRSVCMRPPSLRIVSLIERWKMMFHLPVLSDDDLAVELIRRNPGAAGFIWEAMKAGRPFDSILTDVRHGHVGMKGSKSRKTVKDSEGKERVKFHLMPVDMMIDAVYVLPSHHAISLDDLIELADLTERESVVLALAREGRNEREIGAEFGVTQRAVSYWMTAIMAKLRSAVITMEKQRS